MATGVGAVLPSPRPRLENKAIAHHLVPISLSIVAPQSSISASWLFLLELSYLFTHARHSGSEWHGCYSENPWVWGSPRTISG